MRIGIDLGGTKTEAVLLNAGGDILERRRIPTPVSQGYDAILFAIRDLVNQLDVLAGKACRVGIGTPGALSHNGLIKNANTTCLIGRPLEADLNQLLNRQVRLANDADCFALSEAIDGAARDCRTVFGVILGTGVGGGIVVDRQLLTGPNRIAGEWGHNPLAWADEGRSCYCGRQDCVETYLCGAGLLKTSGRLGLPVNSAETLVSRAGQGDALALSVLEQYADQLARGLAGVINILDPEAIVLGGGLSNVEFWYTALPMRWQAYVFSDTVRTRLLKAVHGDASGVLGAANLWPAESSQD